MPRQVTAWAGKASACSMLWLVLVAWASRSALAGLGQREAAQGPDPAVGGCGAPRRVGDLDLYTVTVWTSPWCSRVLWMCGGLSEAVPGIPGTRRVASSGALGSRCEAPQPSPGHSAVPSSWAGQKLHSE